MKRKIVTQIFLRPFFFIQHAFLFATLIFLSHPQAFANDEKYIPDLPLGLLESKFYAPDDNPLTKEKIELGRALYFDNRLSADNTISCASCHHPDNGFTDNSRVSTGIDGQEGGRNAPTVINRAFSRLQFWDGRAESLEEQSKGPPFNPIEMGMPSAYALEKKIASIKGYRVWFVKVFGRRVNLDDMAKAIASFERTVVSGDSRYDKYIAANRKAFQKSVSSDEAEYSPASDDLLTDQEIEGMILFKGKAKCSLCHFGFNFTDEDFHNLGVGWDTGNIDLGRYMVTNDPFDISAFKTPTLRDISKTDPYMHDGSQKTLQEVIDFYNRGGIENPYRSELIKPLGLSDQEVEDLLAFLMALDGKGWQNIGPPKTFPR